MAKSDGKPILLDSNLMVLLVIGTASRSLIAKHKKARIFTPLDFDRLIVFLGRRRVMILPHIAAEASNLISFHDEPERKRLLAICQRVVEAIDEEYVPSRHAARQSEFRFLGMTDAAILSVTPPAEILTTDANLYIAALKRGLTATNFNHFR